MVTDLRQTSAAPTAAAPETRELAIEGMTCASCVRRVERALGKVEGVESVSVNLATERASVHGDTPLVPLLAAVERAGYHAQPVVEDLDETQRDEDARGAMLRRRLAEIVLGAVLTIPLVLLGTFFMDSL